MALFNSTLNIAKTGLSSLSNFSYPNIALSGIFIVPLLITFLVPVLLFAAVASCISSCFGSNRNYGQHVHTNRSNGWFNSWWSTPSRAYTQPTCNNYYDRPHSSYTRRTHSHNINPAPAYQAPSSSRFFDSQTVNSNSYSSAPPPVHSGPSFGMGGGSQHVG